MIEHTIALVDVDVCVSEGADVDVENLSENNSIKHSCCWIVESIFVCVSMLFRRTLLPILLGPQGVKCSCAKKDKMERKNKLLANFI